MSSSTLSLVVADTRLGVLGGDVDTRLVHCPWW